MVRFSLTHACWEAGATAEHATVTVHLSASVQVHAKKNWFAMSAYCGFASCISWSHQQYCAPRLILLLWRATHSHAVPCLCSFLLSAVVRSWLSRLFWQAPRPSPPALTSPPKALPQAATRSGGSLPQLSAHPAPLSAPHQHPSRPACRLATLMRCARQLQ